MAKKITIEKLAEMSQREFTAIRGEVAEGFARVDKRFDGMEKRIDGLDNKFDNLAEVLRLMHADLKEIKSDVQLVHFDYTELKTRVERLEKKVGLSK
jgi:archaellum component FlaC